MAEPHAIAAERTRERWLVAALVAAVVVARSAVLVFWEQAQFDSDQAVVGLMAKHLAERRAFPFFYCGQNYMLGVEAWLAAPLVGAAGASVTALKLPLLAINVLVALLLLRVFAPAQRTAAQLIRPRDNITDLVERVCLDPQAYTCARLHSERARPPPTPNLQLPTRSDPVAQIHPAVWYHSSVRRTPSRSVTRGA